MGSLFMAMILDNILTHSSTLRTVHIQEIMELDTFRLAFFGAFYLASSATIIQLFLWAAGSQWKGRRISQCSQKHPEQTGRRFSNKRQSTSFQNSLLTFVPNEEIQNKLLQVLTKHKFVCTIPLVRSCWSTLKPNNLEPTISRTCELLREKDLEAANAFEHSCIAPLQRAAFCAFFGTLLSHCDDSQTLAKFVLLLGAKHKESHFHPRYYRSLSKSLILSMKEKLSATNQWDTDIEHAWNTFLLTISTAIILTGDHILMG